LGGALSIIDKYDTLSSYFGMKIEPTGDEDPFGLRRAAQGIVEVTWDFKKPLFLKQLWQARICMEPFTSLKPQESESIGKRLNSYILERLYTFEWAKKDAKNTAVPGRDVVDAVLSSKTDDLLDVMVRIQALSRMDGKKALLHSAKIVERTHNILKSASLKQDEVKEELLQEQAEKELWQTCKAQKDKIVGLIEKKAYAEATESYAEAFYNVLHDFFESVMVNVKEEGLQQNRLALMRTINALYTHRIADLSKLFCLQNQK
jgi:glycyl-tRNA synthetase beta chain